LLLLLLSPPPRAIAARGMEFAVQQDSVFIDELPDRALGHVRPRTRGFQLATQLRSGWIRANLVWASTVAHVETRKKEPKHYTYNWTGYDALVDGAAARGIKVQLAISGPAPAWATANHRVGTYKPRTAAYLKFVRAAVEHFRGRVSRYSIWNEPNYASWLTPLSAAARLYRDYYTRGYALIKQLDPTAQVLFGETAANASKVGIAPLKFLRDVTCANSRYRRAGNCAPLRTDGFAMHPYDLWHKPTYRFPGADNVTLGTIGRLTGALAKLQRARLLTTPAGGTPYIYVTEYGYLSATSHGIRPTTQGKYLVQAFTMAARNPRIKQMLQYLLIKPPSKYTFFDTSIAARNGKPTKAFKLLARWVGRAIKTGQLAAPGSPPSPGGSTGSPQPGGSPSGGSPSGGSPSGGSPPGGSPCVPGVPVSCP
jgi:hypothetical protein